MTGDVNAALLERVLRFVTAHPERWDQDAWAYREPDCGTVCCVAGWTVVLAGLELDWESDDTVSDAYTTVNGEPIPDAAARLLGLDTVESWSLFGVSLTLDDLWDAAAELTGGAVRRDRAAVPA